MRSRNRYLALPTGLLSTLALATSAVNDHDINNTTLLAQRSDVWPYNLPPTVKYFPEHRAHVRREENAFSVLLGLPQPPNVLRKMSADPNEKFFLGYWDLPQDLETREEPEPSTRGGQESGHQRREQAHWENATALITLPLDPAAVLHSQRERSLADSLGWNIFRRAFQCPSGTNPCTSVGMSDLCCPNGQTCVSTSNGIGCCPSGQTCGNTVAPCDTAAGYTSCPNSSNGGCCVPGASCLDVGCVFYGTQIVTTNLPAATVTRTTSSFVFPSTTTQAATVTVTITGAGTLQTTTIISPTTIILGGTLPTASTCTTGFLSCPASLGGGCCPTSLACASGTQCTATAASTDASAPVRGTTISTASSDSLTTSTSYASLCPTGYYMCSAVYLGGCCQVDRDCHTLSCPPTASTSVVNSAVATVVVPVGGSGGTCANGWYICTAAQGGGCCPLGFECGESSCVRAEGMATVTRGKEGATATGNGAVRRVGVLGGGEGRWVMGVLGVGSAVVGVGMVLC